MAMQWAPFPSTADLDSKKPPSFTHMTFFWDTNSEILFPAFPAKSTPLYFIALLLVFGLSVLTEWFTVSEATWKEDRFKSGRFFITGVLQTVMHFLKMGVLYLLMLALMSFNGGVFIVAVLGHAVGFLVFSSGVFDWQLRKAAGAVTAAAYNVNDPSCKC